MKFALGTKENMAEYFNEDGRVMPITIISSYPFVITQVKTTKKDGYNAIQIGYGERKKKNLSKAVLGHLKDLGSFKYLKEFKVEDIEKYKVGDTISPYDLFSKEDKVFISSISKGKGFQGVVKRHGFKGGPRTHGQKHSEREPGSIGGGLRTRVPKGMRMAGRMGGDRITQKNLKIVDLDKENNLIFIKGAIAGSRGSLVEIISK